MEQFLLPTLHFCHPAPREKSGRFDLTREIQSTEIWPAKRTAQHFNKYDKYPARDGQLYHPGNWRSAPLIKSHTFITFIRALSYVPPRILIKLHYPCTCAGTWFLSGTGRWYSPPLSPLPHLSSLTTFSAMRYSLLVGPCR